MATNIKAQIAQVNLGHIQIEGLMGSDGRFYVAVPQIADRFQFDKNQASRDLKALLGGGFQFDKAITPLNPKAVNAVTLDQFHRILIELGFKGNALVREILRDMSALGLHQLFCDAFDIKNNAEDRAAWLQQRIESKQLFWELTQQIKIWMDGRYCSAPEFTYYSNAFDCLNLQLFGKKSKVIRAELGVDSPSGLTRNHFGVTALRNIGLVQSGSARMMEREKVSPTEAVKHIVSVNYIEPVDYRL
jgi:hypothetical protein